MFNDETSIVTGKFSREQLICVCSCFAATPVVHRCIPLILFLAGSACCITKFCKFLIDENMVIVQFMRSFVGKMK